MLNLIAPFIARDTVETLATSALPHAPVVLDPERGLSTQALVPVRYRVSGVLRRMADIVEPPAPVRGCVADAR